MKVAVTGASGNVGTALLRRLATTRPDWAVTGVCRRPPGPGDLAYDRVRWVSLDLAEPAGEGPLAAALDGVDAVVHLAWLIQPGRDKGLLERTNIVGSRRVLQAASAAGVGQVVCASSVGAYSPGPKGRGVDESWPTDGVPTSTYSRQKAAVERLLDAAAARPDAPTVARIRPGLVFQHDAGSEVARYFLGPLVPHRLVGLRRTQVLPVPDAAVFQVVHADDVADAIERILDRGAGGAFNLAAEPVMTPRHLAEVFRAWRVRVPAGVVRAAAAATYAAHLQPTEPGWVDLALNAPVMSTERAAAELGWASRHDARQVVAQLLDGMRRGAGTRSPALAPDR